MLDWLWKGVMKRFLVSICSLFCLLGIGSKAVSADGGKGIVDKQDAQVRTADEKALRQATRDAIRRAVRGGQVAQKAVHEKTYQSIPHEQLGQYIGSWVKLETYFGRKVEGTLKRVKGDTIYVDEHVALGSASYPINKTKISGLKVLK